MKNYYWTLIQSWGRPSRICHEKVKKTTP